MKHSDREKFYELERWYQSGLEVGSVMNDMGFEEVNPMEEAVTYFNSKTSLIPLFCSNEEILKILSQGIKAGFKTPLDQTEFKYLVDGEDTSISN